MLGLVSDGANAADIDVLGLVATVQPDKKGSAAAVQRGEMLRKDKVIAGLKRRKKDGVLSSAVSCKLHHLNQHATRRSQLVEDIWQKKRDRIRGRGKFKQWLPHAILRACFRLAAVAPLKIKNLRTEGQRHRKLRARGGNPTASSATVAAVVLGSSSTYVQRVRDATSQVALERQSKSLKNVFCGKSIAHCSRDCC